MQNQPKSSQRIGLTLNYARKLLLSACCSTLPVAAAHAQNLSCSGSNPVVCSNGAGQNLNSPVGVTNNGTDNLNVTSNANLSVDSSSNPVGVAIYNTGQDGSNQDDDRVDGQRAYAVTLTNNGAVTLGLTGSSGDYISGVRASSRGGVGATPPHDDDGGMGGSGAPVTLTNNAAVTVNQLSGGVFGKGAMGVYAESAGGNGAAPDSAVIDYYGGNGAGAGIVTLTNKGEIVLGSKDAPLVGSTRMWGVAAESFGGNGGDYAKNDVDPGSPGGAGGGGGVVNVNNVGNVSVYWAPVAGSSTSDGIAGVIGRSLGGSGGYSDYTKDGGGNGGYAGQVTINVGQAQGTTNLTQTVVTVSSTAAPEGMSAGVLGISRGGVGGDQHSHGADGGTGGSAEVVDIQLNNTSIQASGDNVAGVLAFSRGGDGGSALDSDGETAGGTGGHAGTVSISLDYAGVPQGQTSVVSTNGLGAYGLLAQSVGGFGGSGTSHGGVGQDAETATITTQADSLIQTSGDYAAGVVAQSIGGGGGTGTDFTIGLAGSGGNGGNGGNGSTATISSAGTVNTQGQYGYGLLAQSIGGSGGTGGVGVGLIVALGGDGGAGGGGGTVLATHSGAISTNGYGASGITGQSIGGGGGAAGSAAGAFAIGGSVADSQNNSGGEVTISNAGSVSTKGHAAIGLLGQSIGGGGGSAASAAGLLSIGGSGASGGNGGTVIVNADAKQATRGNYSHGAVAQSIGGGGGSGGDAFAITTALSTPAIGGKAGGGGHGGAVTLTANNNATVSTSGDGATGLLGQSVGGGGGSGGSALQTSFFAPVSVAIGGSGGGGGAGGVVGIQTSGAQVSTNGASAAGIIAQSVGGGGGNGGAATATDLNLGLSLGVAVGGSGGAGGSASKVSVTLDNTQVSTAGLLQAPLTPGQAVDQTDSYGILAQSIGGGGGNGGSVAARSIALPVPISEDVTFAMASSVAIGGSGGGGGSGDEVDVWLSGNSAIYTAGQGSHAVLAQSIGGGGGNGGDSKAMSRTVTIEDTSIAVNVDVAVGGFGGVSGDAGLVNLQLNDSARIATYSDYSNGLMGQAIGGGGGNGGVGSSGTGGIAKDKSYTVNVGVGGKGKAGGDGGQLEAFLAQGASITTAGSGSRGVLLQSIGGGGGASQGTTVSVGAPFSSGGGGSEATTSFSASVSVSVGEQGGAGGNGGTVTLTNAGTIATAGNDADGMLLQSIGGGGGLGGSAGSDASAGPSSYPSGGNNPDDPPPSDDNNLGSYGLSVAVGGMGGGGGNGGTVNWNYTGNTATSGDLADAAVIQSIGGGGGAGGTSAAKGAKGDGDIMVSVGGHGGSAGDGGEINLNVQGQAGAQSNTALSGQLVTRGNVAYGLLAQSIGGGGGQGADGSSDVTYKTLETPSLLLGVNGSGGNGGKGGALNMNAANSLIGATTYGTGSHAIVLQSIGGGGGAGSLASSDSVTIEGTGLSLQLGGGGNGAASGGGAITVNSTVLTSTYGHGAYGFVAQSIGGGGGIAYAGQAANINSAMIDNSQRGTAYDASGGTLNVTLNPATSGSGGDPYFDIYTTGSAAHGIVLQSIGGGGGIAGDPGASPLQTGWLGGAKSASSTGNANGGDVTLTLQEGVQIKVTGDNSYAVVLQSVADGGGLGGTAQGSYAGSAYDHAKGGGSKAGSITFTQSAAGDIFAYGGNPVGVFAQSVGNTAQASPITLNINGTLQTTTADPNGIGLWLDGGAATNVVNVGNGWISSSTAIKQTGSGVTTLNNSGTVSGSVFLSADDGEAVGVVNNRGTLLNASTVKGSVFNAGQVIIGAPSKIDAMHVTNDFRQSEAGTLHVDADFAAGQADMISVAGSVQLGGRVRINAQTLMPNRELAFLEAASFGSTAAVNGASSLFDYSTRYTGQTASVTARNAYFDDFSSKYGVGSNLREVGSHLQRIWDAGGSEELGSLYAQFDRAAAGQAPGYASALKDLSPGPSAAPAALATGAMKGFSDTLFSCPEFSTDSARTAESNCVWGRVIDKTTRLDSGRGTSATKSDSTSYQLGGQQRIAPNWLLGVSGAYENSTIRSNDDRTRTKGDAGYLGAVLKYEAGPWTFSGATYGNYGTYDNQRSIALTGGQAKSDSKVWSVGQQLRAAYTYATDTAYLKPYASVDLIYTSMPSYEEHGAGALNLKVRSSDSVTALFTPGVEVGGRLDLGRGYTARPFANASVSLASTDKWDSQAQLAAAPAGSRSFKTTLDTGRVFGRASVGVQLSSRGGLDLQLQYDVVASDRVRSSGGAVKATWRY
ncbi:hypothetical protein [Achromobacter aegrifaciens]